MRYFLYDVANDYSLHKVPGKSDFGTLAHAKERGVKDNRGRKVLWKKVDLPIGGQTAKDKFKNWFGRNTHNELIYIISTHGLLKNPKKRAHEKGFIIEDKSKRTCAEIHKQIKGFMEYAKPGAVYECGACHKQFTKAGKNPMARKKKRSAKQLANDKRLGRMAKARAKKKRGGRRKVAKRKVTKRRVVRRRNPKRTALKKSHLWVAFVCWPNRKVNFAYIADSGTKPRVGISPEKGKAVLFKTKTRAHNVAKLLAKTWGGATAGVANADATAAEIKAACKGKA